MNLDRATRRRAFEIAWRHLRGEEGPEAPQFECGAFVRLLRDGGCCGFHGLLTPRPAGEAIRRAVDLARTDPRYDRHDADDLEVWVTGPPRRFGAPDELDPERHGLFVRRDEHRGIHLPVLGVGQDRMTYLESACVAAGLHPTWWRERGDVEILYFEVVPLHDADRAPRTAQGRPAERL